jgi:tRNA(Ile2) C34 agmatinyltransferase TiaS
MANIPRTELSRTGDASEEGVPVLSVDLLICPECGRRLLEFVQSIDDESGFSCSRCGFRVEEEHLLDCYAEEIET